MPTAAYGAVDATSTLGPLTITRRPVGPTDVRIRVTYFGICHSDLHTARSDWPGTRYPCVPGHEVVGEVVEVGSSVSEHQVGDVVGIGCLVDSCGECAECRRGLENYCANGATPTYNGVGPDGDTTNGGYSSEIVVTETFALRIPDGLDAPSAAPILCAGITTYSPLRHYDVGPSTHVGVVGFGGLGSMAVRLAKALGAEVTVITRSDAKAEAARKAGADHVLVSANDAAMSATARSLDLILSTVPSGHDATPYLRLLKVDGAYCVLGAVEPLTSPINGAHLMMRRLSVSGSSIGGLPETQEVLEFCAAQDIRPEIRIIGIEDVNGAYDDLATGDPGFRYVIDMATLTS